MGRPSCLVSTSTAARASWWRLAAPHGGLCCSYSCHTVTLEVHQLALQVLCATPVLRHILQAGARSRLGAVQVWLGKGTDVRCRRLRSPSLPHFLQVVLLCADFRQMICNVLMHLPCFVQEGPTFAAPMFANRDLTRKCNS